MERGCHQKNILCLRKGALNGRRSSGNRYRRSFLFGQRFIDAGQGGLFDLPGQKQQEAMEDRGVANGLGVGGHWQFLGHGMGFKPDIGGHKNRP